MTIEPLSLLMLLSLICVLVGCAQGLMQGIRHTDHLELLSECAERDDLMHYHQASQIYRANTHQQASFP